MRNSFFIGNHHAIGKKEREYVSSRIEEFMKTKSLKRGEYLAEPKIAIIAVGFLGYAGGKSRAVATVSEYFKERAFVITDIHNKKATHTIDINTPVYEIGTAFPSSKSLLAKIVRILRDAFKIKKLAENFPAKVLYVHDYPSLYRSFLAKLLCVGYTIIGHFYS